MNNPSSKERTLLERLAQWDQFNPPMSGDHAYWKREIEILLTSQQEASELDRLTARIKELEVASSEYITRTDPLLDQLEPLSNEVARLTARNSELEKDAARYRWLRGKAGPDLKYGREQYTRLCSVCLNDGEQLDAAIDAASGENK